jgi:hypothetical protein
VVRLERLFQFQGHLTPVNVVGIVTRVDGETFHISDSVDTGPDESCLNTPFATRYQSSTRVCGYQGKVIEGDCILLLQYTVYWDSNNLPYLGNRHEQGQCFVVARTRTSQKKDREYS